MGDVLNPEQRHKCMASIKSKDTKPELIVRKFIFANGLRYRLHDCKLPGKPDLVLAKYRAVVFIDGCFWHSHEGCKYFHIPKSKQDYWIPKLNKNKERDIYITNSLLELGWRVFRVWECELKTIPMREIVLNKLITDIRSIP